MNPSPRAPFDQGLFLAHFNKGKDLYEARRFEEAERELEEAYLLRPRDQKVLNLLGLVYFKQDKFEKAEEVYRKLAAESPEANTLFYNLGLIYFKLSRFEEAESAFLKALELSEENPKINFYLGSIYERQHRFQDAIYQYRQAGANIMVRRIEDKIAATRPAPKPAAPAEPAAGPTTSDTRPAVPLKRPDDTAEFKVQDIEVSLRKRAEEALITPQKRLQPVSSALLAEASRSEPSSRPRRLDDTLPPFSRSPFAATPAAAPAASENVFRFLENNLMEIQFSGKVFIKQGTIYSYGGNLTFWVKEKRPGGQPALVIITGNGKVILTDQDREVTFMHVENEALYVEPDHLLSCEETLSPRYVPIGDGPAADRKSVV